jgi:hypothetical protein
MAAPSRRSRVLARLPRIALLGVVLVGVLIAWPVVFGEDKIGREHVEEGAERALLFAGVGGAKVTCPDGLKPETGARIVCTYTETSLAAAAASIGLETRPPPPKGRAEIWIRDFRVRGSYPSSVNEPQYSARVLEPAR